MSAPAFACPSPSAGVVAPSPSSDWSDQQLVQACLVWDQHAWQVLVAKYKNLICWFPRKYGAPAHEAADVFQLVCTELFIALPRLRNHRSLRPWVTTVAAHQAHQWKRRHQARVRWAADAAGTEATPVENPSKQLLQAEREQLVREAVSRLPNRYRGVIECLFFEDPPVPYQVVAQRLGVAPGSVNFLRARGLRKLARILDTIESRKDPYETAVDRDGAKTAYRLAPFRSAPVPVTVRSS